MVGRAGGVGGPRRPLKPPDGQFWRKAARRGAMTQFLGTHIGKLDRKGRISVPASFRAVLERPVLKPGRSPLSKLWRRGLIGWMRFPIRRMIWPPRYSQMPMPRVPMRKAAWFCRKA